MPRLLPTLAAAFLFVAISGALEGLAARYVSPDLENKVGFALAAMCAGLALIYALLRGPQRVLTAAIAAWPVIAFVALAGASLYWSSAPGDTLQSAIHLMLLCGAAICLAIFADWRALLAGGACAVLCLAALSIILIPAGGLMTEIHPGALRGPWGEKNEAGMIFAFGALCFAALGFASGKFSWALGSAALLPLILLTESTTSLLAFAVGVSAMAAMELMKGRPERLIIGSWFAVVLIAGLTFMFTTNAGSIVEAAGKDMTLTGRSDIWPAVMDRIAERPWLGHGFNAFWTESAPDKMRLWDEINFEAHNAHNGFLETLLGLGIIGTALMAWMVVRTMFCGFYAAAHANDPRRFAVPLVLAILVISVSESILSGPDGMLWFAFVALTVAAVMPPLERQIPISSMRLYAGRSRTLSSQALVAGAPSSPNLSSPFWIWKPIRQSAAENS